MIKITFKTLIDSYNNLKKVAEFDYLVETRYRMAKALMHVETEKAHYDKQYKDLMKKHGEQTGITQYSIKKESLAAFTAEVEALQAIEISIPVGKLLQSNVQEQIQAPADIVALSWLIDWTDLEISTENAATATA